MISEVQRGLIRLCVPDHASGVIQEVFDEDCYRVSEIQERAFVVDIGAHIGCFSLRCALERNCIVLSYEPNPATFGFLVASIAASQAQGRVRAVFSAVGAENGRASFFADQDHPAGSRLAADGGISVPCTSLDRVVEQLPAGFCVLKIDCEGEERAIITEQNADSLRLFDLIVGEWHNHDGARYRDVLEKLRFNVELKGGGVPQPAWDPSIGGGLIYARRG